MLCFKIKKQQIIDSFQTLIDKSSTFDFDRLYLSN